jgi:hypothetical protein
MDFHNFFILKHLSLNFTFQKPHIKFVGMNREEVDVLSVRPPDPAQIEKLNAVTLACFLATNQSRIHINTRKQ